MKTLFLLIILIFSFNSFAQVPIGQVKLSDVCSEIYESSSTNGKSLNGCFTAATGTFNSTYEGNKDRLSNFQGYVHNDDCVLSTPTGLSAIATIVNSQVNITVSWTAAPIIELPYMSSYLIARGVVSGTYTYSNLVSKSATSFTMSGLAYNTRYYIVLKALGDGCNDSENSSEISILTPPNHD